MRKEKYKGYEGRAQWIADNFDTVIKGVKAALGTANIVHKTLGSSLMLKVTEGSRKITGNGLGKWTPSMPTAGKSTSKNPNVTNGELKVVYLPSCASRSMGPAKDAIEQTSLFDKTISLLNKAGYEVIIPENISQQCCGMPFESKGMFNQADQKARETIQMLKKASNNSEIPVYCDTSPCTMRIKSYKKTRIKVIRTN
jgi:D-lactate dehydrogenase